VKMGGQTYRVAVRPDLPVQVIDDLQKIIDEVADSGQAGRSSEFWVRQAMSYARSGSATLSAVRYLFLRACEMNDAWRPALAALDVAIGVAE